MKCARNACTDNGVFEITRIDIIAQKGRT